MYRVKKTLLTVVSVSLTLLLSGCELALLNPKGAIAHNEKQLLILSAVLMLIVVIPVVLMTIAFVWRYRAGNKKADYAPEWAHSTKLEVIWWSIPCVIIIILGVLTWTSTHELDPYKPLSVENAKPITIQAIALDWKWLFVYPEQRIATVNYVQIPVDVPVLFLITAHGAMNSLQIPQLGGQIYAMAGMQTKLNLIANEMGHYEGFSSNFSGEGFSDMRFEVEVGSFDQFQQWVREAQASPVKLTAIAYRQLLQPSIHDPVKFYADASPELFNDEIMQNMPHMNDCAGKEHD